MSSPDTIEWPSGAVATRLTRRHAHRELRYGLGSIVGDKKRQICDHLRPEFGFGGVEHPKRPLEITGNYGLLRTENLMACQLTSEQVLRVILLAFFGHELPGRSLRLR